MALSAGTILGPYEIEAPLGAGGMGEVYKAKDTRLDRTVAIKILPAHLSESPELKERFEREARAVSSLNHPHICTLHDIGHQDGIDFLVMEYLEGESLADRLERGPLSTSEVLRYGIELADALDNAHREGVVHRDLKPGNVMLTPPGAKLVDFGLAKLQAQEAAREMSSLPTQQKPLTEQGSILGTFQYMAPEQLEGKDADARSDLFALGAVLYEMVTGRKAFQGKSQASLISAIMSSEPPSMTELEPLSPKTLERVVRRCLEKDPDKRWQTAAGVLDALRFLAEEGEPEKTPSSPVATGSRLLMGSALGLALGALVAGLVVWSAMRPEPNPVKRFVVNFGEEERLGGFPGHRIAISPDGARIAYLIDRDGGLLMLRAMNQIEARPIAGTEGARHPFFSPDGEWLGFFADGTLKKISLAGGAPLTLAQLNSSNFNGAVWVSDDTILYNEGADILRVPAAGGAPDVLLAPDEDRYIWPETLPGDDAVLYTVWRGNLDQSAIAVFSETTGESRVLVETGTHPLYTASGHIVFARAPDALWAVPFDLDRLDITGSPFPVLEGVTIYPGGASNFGVSHDGSLVYVPGDVAAPESTLVWVDRHGVARPLTEARRTYGHPRLSPDGTRLAVEIGVGLQSDVWVLETARETLTRLTFEGVNRRPIWTPDGNEITFGSSRRRNGVFDILSKPADGSGEAVPMTANDHLELPASWSPDGKTLVFRHEPGDTGHDIARLVPEDGGEAETIVGTGFQERHAALSRDGRWLAYSSEESGRREV